MTVIVIEAEPTALAVDLARNALVSEFHAVGLAMIKDQGGIVGGLTSSRALLDVLPA